MAETVRIDRRGFLLSASAIAGSTAAGFGVLGAQGLAATPVATRYNATSEGIVTRGGPRFGNRPLYGDHRAFTLMAGDRPLLRLMQPPHPLGALLIGWRAAGTTAWLHDFATIDAIYDAGLMRWRLSDPRFPGTRITVTAVTLSGRDGMIIEIAADGAAPDAQAVLMHGALMAFSHPNLLWAADPGLHPSVQVTTDNHQNDSGVPPELNDLEAAFHPANAAGNRVDVAATENFAVSHSEKRIGTRGVTSRPGRFDARNADAWRDPAALLASEPGPRPVVAGAVPMAGGPLYVVIEAAQAGAAPAGVPTKGSPTKAVVATEPQPAPLTPETLPAAFARARSRVETVARRVTCRTPDAQIDAMLPAAAAVINAIFYDPQIVHGAMAWNVPLIGWRSFYGSTCLGWHERLLAVARYYLPTQKTDGPDTVLQDPERRLSLPAENSRFYGRGRVSQDQNFYNMQSVFFDQLIYGWRASGDPELERLLRPALNLHLEWMGACFDPDGDGLYESALDIWASDSIWYSGGPTPYASAYTCRAFDAAAVLADRAGDRGRAEAHRGSAAKIRAAIRDRLWNAPAGCVGEYIESLGHRRRHDDTSLYSIATSIDSDVVDADMAAQMIDYSQWALERVPMPAGGEQCYTTNFVPHVWSVREADTADTLHLALAAWKAGIDDDGWRLYQGGFRQSAFAASTPGAIMCEPPGKKYASVDFSDSTNMFVRATIEGLFGYRANRAEGAVAVAPRFPAEWDHAALDHPDAKIHFERKGGVDRYTVTLPQPARITLSVPVRSAQGVSARYLAHGHMEASFGAPRLVSTSPTAVSRWRVEVPHASTFEGSIGALTQASEKGPVKLSARGGRIVRFEDPQGVLEGARLENGTIVARVRPGVTGRHAVLAEVAEGDAHWRQMLRLDIAAAKTPLATLPKADAWQPVPIELDADLRAIYQQKYLSPRPDVISAQIGVDGFSWWTATFWDINPPKIGVGRIPADGRMTASNGVPFILRPGEHNIAFTSFWDNWPTRRAFPVGQGGSHIALLLSGATNQMQTGIANGQVVIRYADGEEDRHDIHHPNDFWDVGGDYNYEVDSFSLPKTPPPTLTLDEGSRAVAFVRPLRKGTVREIEIETLSMEVIIGLMALSIAT
jgi:hypothetical protein